MSTDFGDGALDFALRCVMSSAAEATIARGDLGFATLEGFGAAEMAIPCAQRGPTGKDASPGAGRAGDRLTVTLRQ